MCSKTPVTYSKNSTLSLAALLNTYLLPPTWWQARRLQCHNAMWNWRRPNTTLRGASVFWERTSSWLSCPALLLGYFLKSVWFTQNQEDSIAVSLFVNRETAMLSKNKLSSEAQMDSSHLEVWLRKTWMFLFDFNGAPEGHCTNTTLLSLNLSPYLPRPEY